MRLTTLKSNLGTLAAISLLAIPTTCAVEPFWHSQSPRPTFNQFVEYVQVHSWIATLHQIPPPSETFPLVNVEYDQFSHEPIRYQQRTSWFPNRYLGIMAHKIHSMIPQLRAELQGPLSPSQIRQQVYGPIAQRLVYYERVLEFVQTHHRGISAMRHMRGFETVWEDVDLIRQTHRLLELAKSWQVHS